jgi:2-keto-myo-inositol isomerase
MVAPHLDHAALFDLARKLDIADVEIRNDLAGVALADGTPAAQVGAAAKERDLTVLAINALQRFNIWNEGRAAEAATMIAQCAASGDQGVSALPSQRRQLRAVRERAARGAREGSRRTEADAHRLEHPGVR